MLDTVISELAPTGILRVGINLANFLLVSGRKVNGDPDGIAPDLAVAIAEDLDVDICYVCFETPRELADAVVDQSWDIGLIGFEPARAQLIDFTAAYIQIESTYLVFKESDIETISDVDRDGVEIAVAAGTAYDLYLTRRLKNAKLVRAHGLEGAFNLFSRERLDALAGLRPGLLGNAKTLDNTKILDGGFTMVQQAIGIPARRTIGYSYLCAYVEDAKASGFIAELISRHDVEGISVASCV